MSNFASLNFENLRTTHARKVLTRSQTWEPKKTAPEGPQDNPHDGDDDDGDETRVERGCLQVGGQGSLVTQPVLH